MRLPESKIKASIQHPEEEVRLTALRYFTDSLNDDESVMPLVIQAVETYGVDSAFRILRDADQLPQTESTISWLIGHALLAHFEFDGIELVRQLAEGDEEDLHPDERDLRSRLVAAATIMEATFPEYDEWHDDAVRTNYGWFEYERRRIAENFES